MSLEAIETAKKAVENYASHWYMVPICDDWGNPLPQEPGCADYSSCEELTITNAEIDPEFESPYEDGSVIGVTVTVNWKWTDEEPDEDVELLIPVWEQDGEWFHGEIEKLN
jgi:hypothetical protein